MNFSKLVEQFPICPINFGRKGLIYIEHNGDGVDQINLKIVLPELPAGIAYKPVCVYDLIGELELDIGGYQIFSFCSAGLELFDKVNRNFDAIMRCCTVKNNTFTYPIDLKYFFKESTSDNPDFNSCLDLNFHGIRIDPIHTIQLYIKLKTIFDIIISTELNDNLRNSLSGLQMENVSAFVNYISVHMLPEKETHHIIENDRLGSSGFFCLIPNPLNLFCNMTNSFVPAAKSERISTARITQRISKWEYFNCHSEKTTLTLKYKLAPPAFAPMSKIYICSEFLYKVSHFMVQIDGQNYIEKMSLCEYKQLQEYTNDKILDDQILALDINFNMGPDTILTLQIWLDGEVDDFDLAYLCEYPAAWVYKKKIEKQTA